jgi:chitinase
MSPHRTIALVTGLAVVALPLCVGDAAGSRPRPDRRPPTAPTGLTVSNITQTGGTFTWNKSTDNVGVAGYDVYVDGKRVGTTPP